HVMTAHTKDMICGVRDHIRFLSGVLTLRPGDLITTGTPAGVAKLAPGDRLKGSIDRVGEMELRVEAEKGRGIGAAFCWVVSRASSRRCGRARNRRSPIASACSRPRRRAPIAP